MTNYALTVKNNLNSIIKKMAHDPSDFVKNPDTDFTRNRKLSFETMIKFLLSMGGNSLSKELMDYWRYDLHTPTPSAFVQQRKKILPSTFEFLLRHFTQTMDCFKLYRGYRLLAIDGSRLHLPTDPQEQEYYLQSKHDRAGYNLMHLNALYDLCNKIYLDVHLQPAKAANENKAFMELLNRTKINDKVIVIGDRGYESYNNFAQIEQKGWYYLIRAKDIKSSGILGALTWTDEEEFDKTFDWILTKKRTKESLVKKYKCIATNTPFTYFDEHEEDTYPISLRVVRFQISEGFYETIITNLSSAEFCSAELKQLYHIRWGVETAFRELKYAIGLLNFHAKKIEFIIQEIYARLIMYNFCEMITTHVVLNQKKKKYEYQINFTIAIQICRYFYRCRSKARAPNVEKLIQKNLLPVREGRLPKRKFNKGKTSVSFLYRVY